MKTTETLNLHSDAPLLNGLTVALIFISLNDQISIRNAAGDAPICHSLDNKSQRAGTPVIMLDLDVPFKVELK